MHENMYVCEQGEHHFCWTLSCSLVCIGYVCMLKVLMHICAILASWYYPCVCVPVCTCDPDHWGLFVE